MVRRRQLWLSPFAFSVSETELNAEDIEEVRAKGGE